MTTYNDSDIQKLAEIKSTNDPTILKMMLEQRRIGYEAAMKLGAKGAVDWPDPAEVAHAAGEHLQAQKEEILGEENPIYNAQLAWIKGHDWLKSQVKERLDAK